MTLRKGQPGGIAGLDDLGKVPAEQTQNIEDLNGSVAEAAYYFWTKSNTLFTNGLTAGVYVDALTLITASLPAGNYRIGFHYTWNYSDTNSDFIGLVEIPGFALITYPIQQEPKDSGTDQKYVHTGMDVVAWPGGVMTIKIRFSKTANAGIARIYKSFLEVEKVT
jgi:hypothetical protein